MYRRWDEEEIRFLEDNWGCKPMESIAKELGRSICGIQVKAQKLGLGRFTLSGDYITVYELARAVTGRKLDGKIFYTWRKAGLPVMGKKVKTMNHAVVKLDLFWKWAERNREYLDFSKMEENILGKEPEWVKSKRKWDIEKARLNKNWEWTKEEDEKMRRMYEKGFSTNEIAAELKRTSGATYFRKKKLGIQEPKRKRAKIQRITEEEKQIIERLINESCSYLVISNILKKGERVIRAYTARTYGTENMDEIRCKIKEKQEIKEEKKIEAEDIA